MIGCKSLAFAAGLAVIAMTFTAAVADDTSVAYVEFDGTGPGVAVTSEHNPDADPFKGFFQLVTVKNISQEAWGDFHFQLIRELPGFDPSDVYFSDELLSICSQSGAYYEIDNAAVGGPTLDFYFYGSPVLPDQTVSFQVYTDNTIEPHNPFAVMYYPTPVPEPLSLTLMGLGAVVLTRRR